MLTKGYRYVSGQISTQNGITQISLKDKVGKMEIFTLNTLPSELNVFNSKIKITLTRTAIRI